MAGKTVQLLLALQDGPRHGYSIAQWVAKVDPTRPMGPGTLSGTMKRMLEEGDVLRSGCHSGWRTVVPVLRLGTHPEMERPAILNRSIPSTAGATIGIPPVRAVDKALSRSISLR